MAGTANFEFRFDPWHPRQVEQGRDYGQAFGHSSGWAQTSDGAVLKILKMIATNVHSTRT
jgi:hypothetical protein